MTEPIGYCVYCTEPKQLAVVHNPGDTFVRCLSCGARGPKAKDMADAVLLWNAASNALEAVKRRHQEMSEYAVELQKERDTLREQLRINSENAEIQSFKLLAERDEARRIARKLWREKQTITCGCGLQQASNVIDCPECNGRRRLYLDDGMTITCLNCGGTGKVMK